MLMRGKTIHSKPSKYPFKKKEKVLLEELSSRFATWADMILTEMGTNRRAYTESVS